MTTFPTLAARLAALAAVAGAGTLIAACGTAAPAPAPVKTVTQTVPAAAGASTPAAPAASTPAAAADPGCLASGLQAQLGASQGTAGTFYQVVVLTNTSGATCTLYGYPGVSFVTGIGGSQVGAPATRNAVVPVTLITLAPGDQANMLLAVHDAGAIPPSACQLTTVDWLRIFPPGDYGDLYVQYKALACGKASESIMAVSAVGAGQGSAA